MANVDLPEEKIRPMLLPKKTFFTSLLIKDLYNQNFHVGVSHTLAQKRSKYRLPKGRTQVKQVLAKCLICIKHQGPYKVKLMASWPKIKVNESAAFINTGLDYFVPLYVKNEQFVVNHGYASWLALQWESNTKNLWKTWSQLAFNCLKLIIETLEQGVKYFQS